MVLNYLIVGHHNLWSCPYFGLDLVSSEFELDDLRNDTLAFDRDSKEFVIIEYKKDRNMYVVDQGVAYLNLTLKKRPDGFSDLTLTSQP